MRRMRQVVNDNNIYRWGAEHVLSLISLAK